MRMIDREKSMLYRTRRIFLVVICITLWAHVNAQEVVNFSSADPSVAPAQLSGLLNLPNAVSATNQRRPAVVILHAGWGWEKPFTAPYAKALNAAGFITLEPRLFGNETYRKRAPLLYLPETYGALQFLASRPDVDPQRIAVTGFSTGGYLSLAAATSWSAEKYGGPNKVRFAAHAPVYPVCWAFSAYLNGKFKSKIFPDDLYLNWTGSSVRIFTGALDDYDDRDPNACKEFVDALPTRSQLHFSIKVYPNATHGWDQDNATFFESMACKGRGCTNHNVSNSVVTRQSIDDIVEFMKSELK